MITKNNIISVLTKNSIDEIKITPCQKGPKAIHNSVIGGKPYWPKDKKYPKTKEGKSLYLLAQLNFEEMPKVDQFPLSGILQFYIADDQLHGLDFDTPLDQIIDKPDGYRVIYHSEVYSDPQMLEHDVPDSSSLQNFPVEQPLSLKFCVEQELPGTGDYRFYNALEPFGEIDEDCIHEVFDYLFENINETGTKLGGNAFFTQHDPRESNKGDEDWTLLFQMDSTNENGVKINWGDLGVANFFIQPEALIKRDFSNVWYNWDCF
jgi:uncharacterized protein YwqG